MVFFKWPQTRGIATMVMAATGTLVAAATKKANNKEEKRPPHLSWNDYFMAMACLSSRCSKDSNIKIGSCLIGEDKRVIGVGWNHFPRLISVEGTKLKELNPYVIYCAMHAHAIVNSSCINLKNSTMYTMIFPLFSTELIVQAGISNVVYLSDGGKYPDYLSMKASKAMMGRTQVTSKLFEPDQETIVLKMMSYKDAEDAKVVESTKEAPSYDLSKEDYFMYVALLAAQRSKDKERKVGACIVKPGKQGTAADDKVVGIGYNGMPEGDDELSWKKDDPDKDTKYQYVVHAEANAIFYRNTADLSGCKIYVTLTPCDDCAKAIIQSGITEVIILDDKNKDKKDSNAGKEMLKKMLGEGKIRVFDKPRQKLTIDFKEMKRRLDEKTPPSDV